MGKKMKIPLKMSYDGAVALASDSNYNLMTALYELIDNSFASKATEVRVEVRTNQQDRIVYVEVTDNGKGLPKEEIETALAPGGAKGDDINEHGVGMKAALTTWEFLTNAVLHRTEEWHLDELNPDENDLAVEIEESNSPSSESGMVVSITCNVDGKAAYDLNHNTVSMTTKKLALGHRYADILDKPNKELILEVKNQDGSKTKKSEKIDPWHAEYDSVPVHAAVLEGSNYQWKATLSIYKLKEKSGHYDPIKNGTGLGGIDIVMHGRCVVKRTKAPLVRILNPNNGEPIKFNHPSYNRLYGRLIVEYGIKTTPKKDNIQENDPPFVELTHVLADTWEEKDVSKYFKEEETDEITESQIEDNLMQLLNDDGYADVEHQQEIGFGFRTDVQALKEGQRYVWEVKKGKGLVNDLLQLVNYVKITKSKGGILLADGFHGDVKKYAKDHWGDYDIEYWDLNSIKYKALKMKPTE